jgi:AcrR family transcriptional regulator
MRGIGAVDRMAKAGPRADRGTAGRRAQSAEVKAALVAASIEALREAGFAGASAREIASRAGCSQALVFYHFGSVNDLLLAALDDVSARRMEAYRDPLVSPRTVTGGLAAPGSCGTDRWRAPGRSSQPDTRLVPG